MKRRFNSIVVFSILLTLNYSCKDQEFYEKEIYETFDDQTKESLPSDLISEYENNSENPSHGNANNTSEIADHTENNHTEDNHNEDNQNENHNENHNENVENYESEDQLSDDNHDNGDNDDSDDNDDSQHEGNSDHTCHDNNTHHFEETEEETEEESQTNTQDEFLVQVTDEFIQNDQGSKIDILWVIDNSGSMEDEQSDLAYNFDVFIKDFITKNIDFKMAITTTDTSSRNSGRASSGSISALTKSKLDQDKNQFLSDFSKLIQVGTSGSGYEKGLKAASSFTKRYESSFFRNDAFFVTVFVSDEDDQSDDSPAEYVSEIKSKLSTPSKIKFYSIVSHSEEQATNWYTPGHKRYLEATELTGGKISDIKNNFYETLQEMGQDIAKLTESFSLQSRPVNDEIKVYVDDNEIPNGWSYDANTRTISFASDAIPNAGSKIKVQYFIQK